jgi:hypothetical protein
MKRLETDGPDANGPDLRPGGKWAIEALTVFTQRSSWKYFHYQGDSIPNR